MSTSPADQNTHRLFANLRAGSSKGQPASQQNPGHQGTDRHSYPFGVKAASPQTQHLNTFQSGITSPGLSSDLPPSHSRESAVDVDLSRHTTPARTPGPPGAAGQMTNPLLNLLKFGSQADSPQVSPLPQPLASSRPEHGGASTLNIHGRGISASDLVANFMGGKPSAPTPREKTPATSSINHQDALLRLLNQTTSRQDGAQYKAPGSSEATANQISESLAGTSLDDQPQSFTDAKSSISGRKESPIRFFGADENVEPTPFQPRVSPKPESGQNGGSIFTYVNPFEQLAASSPRHVKPRSLVTGESKRKIKSPSPAAAHSASRRKLTPSGSEVLQSIESPATERAGEGRSRIEALIGIGAPGRDAETVADALNEVGGQVNRQVEHALAEAEEKAERKEKVVDIKQEHAEDPRQATLDAIEEQVHDAAVGVKSELDKEENQGVLEESMPAEVAEVVKDVIDEAAQGKVTDEWESAEAEDDVATKKEAGRTIQVYQFPMRPFVSIDLIQKEPAKLAIREESVVNIARFKKDFDQADRTLATATSDFIVYGMPKNGGIRIIQQDNGNSSLIYSKRQDRIFNVAISAAHSGSLQQGTQTVIATGVSGTVYWTSISKAGEELTQSDMEKQGLIIPPTSSQSDSAPGASGGQLKTRAKKSSRHPEFFAIGRGKSIQIVFSSQAQGSHLVNKDAVMDTEKYFAERSLKVTTGKAGKDFTFSEDDSTIVSLDKAGKLRIWDIRELVDEANASASALAPIEVKTPLMTFATAHSTEKTWPTSVLFVDKLRPYTKGTALRYIVVGMKQNHTLQLWDLCLGKAVQDLSFPHEHETDAICSVTYHPASGIIAVGHPTRNSIYFIHLSAPKYNLPGMSQAKFVQRLANKDTSLPKAESTAIMSGMREYSFASKGQLRSVELVPSPGEPTKAVEDEEDPILFELYVMHSKGVTCLGIKKEDLGWSKDSRVLHPVDAEQEGRIVVKDLREPPTPSTSDPSSTSANGDTLSSATPANAKVPLREPTKSDRAGTDDRPSTPIIAEKPEKKKSKRNGATETVSRATPVSSFANSYATAAQRGTSPTPTPTPQAVRNTKDTSRPNIQKHASREAAESKPAATKDHSTHPVANGDSISLGISADFLDKELKKIEHGVSNEFNKVIGKELDSLYRRFADDKRVQDAAGNAKQDAMLRLVSSTLGENVERSLSRIIQSSIQDSVIPSITDVTSTLLSEKLSTALAHQLHNVVPPTIKAALPEAISRTMRSHEILGAVSEQITKSVAGHVEKEFSSALSNKIIPAFSNLAVNVAHQVSSDTERRVRDQLQKTEIKRSDDSAKIDQLTNLVRGLSETVRTMAAAQSDFQNEILKLQPKVTGDGQALARTENHAHSPTPSESASMHVSPEQAELELISNLMDDGQFEEATVLVSNEILA